MKIGKNKPRTLWHIIYSERWRCRRETGKRTGLFSSYMKVNRSLNNLDGDEESNAMLQVLQHGG